jgi:TonB family protein
MKPYAVIALMALVTNSHLLATQPEVLLNEKGRRLMLAAPQPEYPPEALASHIQGTGVYDVWIRPDTGVVTRVDILRSSGSKLLDDAAVRSLRQWRARPNALSRLSVPIRFCVSCR